MTDPPQEGVEGRPPSGEGRWARLYRRLVALSFPGRVPDEGLDEMVQVFREGMAAARRRGRPGVARYLAFACWSALRDGGAERLKGVGLAFGGVGPDLRLALRKAASRPLFTLVATVSLTVGIGLNALLFNAVDALLFTPLPVPAPGELVRVFDPGGRDRLAGAVPLEAVDALDREVRALTGVTGFQRRRVGLEAGAELRLAMVEAVTPGYFDVLGVAPVAGRAFTPRDTVAGGVPVAVLSRHLARSLPGREADRIGSEIRINGKRHRVVGIVPEPFSGSHFAIPVDLWLPLVREPRVPMAARGEAGSGAGPSSSRAGPSLEVVGRLRPDADRAEAEAQVRRVLASGDLPPEVRREARGYFVLPEREGLVNPAMPRLLDIGAGVATLGFLVLLFLACTNVAGMLLARTAGRSKEIAVRVAVGASRLRIVRQLLVETLVLVVPGTVLGAAAAGWAEPALTHLIPPLATLSLDFSVDGRLVAFVVGLGLAATFLATVLPARGALRRAEVGGGRGGRGGTVGDTRALDRLVVAQVAVTSVALLLGGLCLRTYQWYLEADPGFATEGRVAVTVDVALHGLDAEAREVFYRDLLSAAGENPELAEVALAGGITSGGPTLQVGAGPENVLRVPSNTVSSGYFRLLEIPVREGRTFSPGEGDGPVVVVNRTLARRLWPDGSPVGRTLPAEDPGPLKVLGVVEDVRKGSLSRGAEALAYLPVQGRLRDRMTLLARGRRGEAEAIEALRRAVGSIQAGLPLVGATTLEAWVEGDRLLARAGAALGLVAGLLALLMAAVGVWGSVAFAVRSRRAELGVRLALGAGPGRLARSVLARGLGLAASGVILGVPAGLGLSTLARNLLVGVGAFDGAVLAAAVGLVLVGVGLALAGPAAATAALDPAAALRDE